MPRNIEVTVDKTRFVCWREFGSERHETTLRDVAKSQTMSPFQICGLTSVRLKGNSQASDTITRLERDDAANT
jgi:hypothetical protein